MKTDGCAGFRRPAIPAVLAAILICSPEAPGASSRDEALDQALREAEAADAEPAVRSAPGDESPQDALERELESMELSPSAQSPWTAPPATSDIYSRDLGQARLRFIDISLDALIAAGTSTEDDDSLQSLQGGGHDPRKRGFTVQNVELSFLGAVDPYFTGEAHVIFFIEPDSGESEFELEEAFLTTQALPWGFQLEGGQMFTEFGRLNPQHPHQWEWLDQPVVNTRFFGPDGIRNPGFRLGWLSPLPWYSELHGGMQNANGETMYSFLSEDELAEERPIAGRPFVDRDVHTFKELLYLVRWDNGFDITDTLSSKMGLSFLYGPNSTGRHGFTRVYGADVVVKWRPLDNDHGWPFVIFQTEIMRRDYHADSFFDEGDPADPGDDVDLDSETFHDWGVYTQVLYGFRRKWAGGLRYGYSAAEGSKADPQDDPFRDTRHRISPLVVYQPTEFSRLRLQYNYDHAQHLSSNEAHSVWFGVEFLFGDHAAHSY